MSWTEERLKQMIVDKIEENLNLDYKGAGALGKIDTKKKEITKDVSAFANSAGGTIIYGIREFDAKEQRHLPARIDPVSRLDFPKEWLEQVIGNIQPRVQSIIIHSVQIGPNTNDVVYVVEIPKSTTAHQATDGRYYRRYNFESIQMVDHEIRDIMNRQQHPLLELEASIRRWTVEEDTVPFRLTHTEREIKNKAEIDFCAYNISEVFALYVSATVLLPVGCAAKMEIEKTHSVQKIGDRDHYRLQGKNTHRDVIGMSGYAMNLYPNYGPTQRVPILPEDSVFLFDFDLDDEQLDEYLKTSPEIIWYIRADNAPSSQGVIKLSEVSIRDERDSV